MIACSHMLMIEHDDGVSECADCPLIVPGVDGDAGDQFIRDGQAWMTCVGVAHERPHGHECEACRGAFDLADVMRSEIARRRPRKPWIGGFN